MSDLLRTQPRDGQSLKAWRAAYAKEQPQHSAVSMTLSDEKRTALIEDICRTLPAKIALSMFPDTNTWDFFTIISPHDRALFYEYVIADSERTLRSKAYRRNGAWPRLLLTCKLVLRELMPLWESRLVMIRKNNEAKIEESEKKKTVYSGGGERDLVLRMWREEREDLDMLAARLKKEFTWVEAAKALLE